MAAQFVILEHRWNGIHWDFMLEAGDVLRTWAIDAPIVAGATRGARPLSDHRLVYLDYEGEISMGRGTVTRLDRGVYEPLVWTGSRIDVNLRGDRFKGRVELIASDDQSEGVVGVVWSFRFEEGNFD